MPVSRGRSPSARAFIPIFPVSNHGITILYLLVLVYYLAIYLPVSNGEPLLKRSSSYSHSFPVCNDSAFGYEVYEVLNGESAVLIAS